MNKRGANPAEAKPVMTAADFADQSVTEKRNGWTLWRRDAREWTVAKITKDNDYDDTAPILPTLRAIRHYCDSH